MTYATEYRAALREISKSLLPAPFRNGFFSDAREAIGTLLLVGAQFACWLIAALTYPISIFVIAALMVLQDRQSKRARAAWLKEMSRGDCIDWAVGEP